MNATVKKKYADMNILITGGLGFVGSSLAKKLVPLGPRITLLAKPSSTHSKKDWIAHEKIKNIEVLEMDMRDTHSLGSAIKNKDVIFDFAAQTQHIKSALSPREDWETNCETHLNLLACCRESNPDAKIVFSSSRLVVGKMLRNPVTEEHPTNPTSIYGIHKLTAEKYNVRYSVIHNLKTTVLRITNVYGECDQDVHSSPIPNLFMQKMMRGETVEIHGDGGQLRDYIHIDDLTDALIRIGVCDSVYGDIFNLGCGTSTTFIAMTELVQSTVGAGEITYISRPQIYEDEESGDFVADISKICGAISWEPTIGLREGLEKMYRFYKSGNVI